MKPVSLRPLFAIMIAVAMLFAPLALQSGAAMAMAPADHHSLSMKEGHCDEQPAQSSGDKIDDLACCAAMCTAIAVVPIAMSKELAFASSTDLPTLVESGYSFLAELPTPPPRLA